MENLATSQYSSIITIVLMLAVFYFLLIRPQRKQQKTRKEMLGNLKVGDVVTTIGRLYGTVVKIKDDIITVSVGPDDTKLMFDRRGIDSVNETFDAESMV